MKINIPKFAILVAGGSGSRMNAVIPKQFILLDNKPILVHTIERFLECKLEQIVLALPEKDIAYWETQVVPNFESIQDALSKTKLLIVKGGDTRYQSVRSGILALGKIDGLVAIHDGVRPFVSAQLIEKSFEIATQKGSAVLAVDSKDSVRILDENGMNKHIDRSKVKLIQTPQTFDLEMIYSAFELGEQPHFTDDASVFEFAGHSVTLMEGSYENIKITTPEDLFIAQEILQK
ncbi:2-C-methyl-D-erythritol 4-phosphate cytidylyltransferase [Spirosomataceae bacterium TFI 002]|nr:2-C-methyl-D-erythritol 4-phosphate cytidylyltransferase [Spirosomataceae bacterium TFI 002]